MTAAAAVRAGALAVLATAGMSACRDGRATVDQPVVPPVVAVPWQPSGGDWNAAVTAAARWQLAHCSWSWRDRFEAHLADETRLATPEYAARLAARTDRTSWQREVVAQRQVVSCSVTRAGLAAGAPHDTQTAYVRLTVTMHVSSIRGSWDSGPLDATAVMRLTPRAGGARWLVDGPFVGG
jgi:hypothetical protein